MIQDDLANWPTNIIQGHCTPFDRRHSVNEVITRLNQREKRHAPDMDFSFNSAITFTFDLETWYKVTANSLLKSSDYVKYKPNRVKWGIYIFSKKNFVWSNMILTADLQTSFKVTAHSLSIGNLWVKFEPDWTKGKEDMLRKRILYIIVLLWPSALT